MRRLCLAFILLALWGAGAMAQSARIVRLDTGSGVLEGTLRVPADGNGRVPVALIIAGSGPTDRNGNNGKLRNNSLKLLAEALEARGIASLRYDKRGIGRSKVPGQRESDLRFGMYVDDASRWIALLKRFGKFGRVVVIGHSEGSLIGMIAARQAGADKFVSLAGAGQDAATFLKRQLKNVNFKGREEAFAIIDKLSRGQWVRDAPGKQRDMLRPSVQPYLISWFRYDPAREIARLKIPVLIVQGTTDLQASMTDARLLARANPRARLVRIEGMNHIMKKASANRVRNFLIYLQPNRPLHPALTPALVRFIGR